MARQVKIDITTALNLVVVQDYDSATQINQMLNAGIGEFAMQQTGHTDLTNTAAALTFIHQYGTVFGSINIADVESVNINGNAATITNLEDLRDAVAPYFFSFGDGYGMTIAELLALQTAGTLPSGRWVFVSDICDRGGWLFCSSATTVDQSGFGLFLNAAFTLGDTSGVEELTGIPVGLSSKWNPAKEAIEVTASSFVGTFSVGATVADQHGWTGVVIETDNSSYINVYSTAGYLPTVGDFLDNGSGVTCDVDAAAKQFQTGTIYVAIDPTDADGTYLNYQLIDEESQNGTNPAVNTIAYTLLPKASAGMGYNLVSAAMSISLASGVVYRRTDSLGNHIEGPSGNATNNACYRFPWGDSTFRNCRTTTGSTWNIHNSIGAEINSIQLEFGSNCELSINRDAYIQGLKIGPTVAFTGKTLAANTTIVDMYVAQDDEATETLTYATWTHDGTRRKVVEFTPTQLTTAFSTDGFIELLPALGASTYPEWELDIVNRGDGSEAYAGGNVIEIKSGTQVLARVDITLLTTAPPDQMVAIGVKPSQLQGVNARFQPTAPNQALVLTTIGLTDFTLVDVANGSRVYAEIRYNTKTILA